MNARILVIDDEESICEIVKYNLLKEGYEVDVAYSAEDALEMDLKPYDLFIVDIMMERLSGFDFAKTLRNSDGMENVPIIFCSALNGEDDTVMGLNIGADDYITKPFNPLEVVARVKTQLRRYTRYNVGKESTKESAAELNEMDIRGLHISRDNHKCLLNGNVLTLTPTEFDILWYLCGRRGCVVSSEELFEAVWGEKYLDNNNTVMTHIARLREKMREPARRPKYIKTIWGVGYTIE